MEREIATFTSDVPDLRHPIARGALAKTRSDAATRRLGSPRAYVAAIVVTATVVGAGTPIVVIFALRFMRLPPAIAIAAYLPILFGTALFSIWVSARAASRGVGTAVVLVIDALLRMGRCACCGYPLDPHAPHTADLACCPECGAAWRAERIGREAVPSGHEAAATFARGAIIGSALCRTRRRDDRGRPWASAAVPRATASDAVRWNRLVDRALWLRLAASSAVMLGGFALAVAILARESRPPLGAMVLASSIALGGFVLAMIGFVRIERESTRRRLRTRACLACRCRLRRDGEFLVCERCDAAWRRPTRARRA